MDAHAQMVRTRCMLTIAPMVSGFIMARIASGLLSMALISGLLSAIARSCGFEFIIVCMSTCRRSGLYHG